MEELFFFLGNVGQVLSFLTVVSLLWRRNLCCQELTAVNEEWFISSKSKLFKWLCDLSDEVLWAY